MSLDCPREEVGRMLSTGSISAVTFSETSFQGALSRILRSKNSYLGLEGLNLPLTIRNQEGKIPI